MRWPVIRSIARRIRASIADGWPERISPACVACTPGADILQQARSPGLDQIERMVEFGGAAVIGIWNIEQPTRGGIFEKQAELRRRTVRAKGQELSVVALIKRDDVIELGEVGGRYLAGALFAEVVTTSLGRRTGPSIGWLAAMEVDRPGGVDLDVCRQSGTLDEPAEDTFRHRRATDIAGTNE